MMVYLDYDFFIINDELVFIFVVVFENIYFVRIILV